MIGPSAERFASMNDFATDVIGQQLRRYNYSTKQARAVENNYLTYPEQSFVKRYWLKVMRVTIEGGGRARMGYDWQWRTLDQHEACARGGEEAECQPSHFMSRLYNARPYDCSTCSADYVTKVKIAPTHFHPNSNRSPNPALTLLTLSRTPNPTLTLTLALPLLNPITLTLTPILTLTRSRSCTTPVAPSHGGTPGRICSDAPPTAAAAQGWRLALPTGRCDGTWHATRSVVRGRRTSGCNCQTAVSETWAWRMLKRRRMHHFWYRVASRDVVWLLVTKYCLLSLQRS